MAATAKLMGALWSGGHGTPTLSVWENSGRVEISLAPPYYSYHSACLLYVLSILPISRATLPGGAHQRAHAMLLALVDMVLVLPGPFHALASGTLIAV